MDIVKEFSEADCLAMRDRWSVAYVQTTKQCMAEPENKEHARAQDFCLQQVRHWEQKLTEAKGS